MCPIHLLLLIWCFNLLLNEINHFALQLFLSHSTISCPYATPHALIYFANQIEPAKPSDQCTPLLTFYSQHLLLDSLGFWQVIWLEIYSVSLLPQAPGRTSICLSCIIHSFSKPTYSCSGSHGARRPSPETKRYIVHIQVPNPTLKLSVRPMGNQLLFIIIILLMSNNPRVRWNWAIVKRNSGLWRFCQ